MGEVVIARWLLLALPTLALAAQPDFRLERVPVHNGAELLTIFATVPEQTEQVPLVSVLRDTLGDADPANDRLRYVWTLTSSSPSLLQRAAAAVPFFYFRTPTPKPSGKPPAPAIDLGNTSSVVWNSLAQQIMQVAAIDSNGALIRAASRRYRTNLSDRRRVHLMSGLAVVSQLENSPEALGILSESELLEIQARLNLSGQMLGGLVTAGKLNDAYFTQRTRQQENRGHNWELLRQRAEANGLYFEPMGLGESFTHAMLWIAREDAAKANPSFDSKFLGISNPFADRRVRDWSGISVTRYYAPDGRQVEPSTPGAAARELMPLAFYSLDYPKVPLLLIDFRNTYSPKRREMLARATTDAVMGLIGYSRWGNWPYMAGSFLYNFTITRRGSATNGAERLSAYSTARRWLALDHDLPPELRHDLQRRLEWMGVNPLEESVFQEMRNARRQYAALRAYAADPQGLAAKLDKARAAELVTYEHGPAARAGFALARVATFGIFKHRESETGTDLLQQLAKNRRATRPEAPVEAILLTGPNVAGN